MRCFAMNFKAVRISALTPGTKIDNRKDWQQDRYLLCLHAKKASSCKMLLNNLNFKILISLNAIQHFNPNRELYMIQNFSCHCRFHL